jgi:hypothetical protein
MADAMTREECIRAVSETAADREFCRHFGHTRKLEVQDAYAAAKVSALAAWDAEVTAARAAGAAEERARECVWYPNRNGFLLVQACTGKLMAPSWPPYGFCNGCGGRVGVQESPITEDAE